MEMSAKLLRSLIENGKCTIAVPCQLSNNSITAYLIRTNDVGVAVSRLRRAVYLNKFSGSLDVHIYNGDTTSPVSTQNINELIAKLEVITMRTIIIRNADLESFNGLISTVEQKTELDVEVISKPNGDYESIITISLKGPTERVSNVLGTVKALYEVTSKEEL